jgi:hypothetical protein
MIFHELLECYNIPKEEHDEEDPNNVKVPRTEGECAVEGKTPFRLVYGQEAMTSMDFILPSLHIPMITDLLNSGTVEERLS